MKIRTKLILILIGGLTLSISVSIAIASFLINHQNQQQNEIRLQKAFGAIEKGILSTLQQFDNQFQAALQDNNWGYFNVLVDSDPAPLLVLDKNLSQLLVKIGISNSTDYGFYSNFGASQGELLFHYSQALGNLIIGQEQLIFGEYGLEWQLLENPITALPSPDQVAMGYELRVFEGIPYLTFKNPYVYRGKDRDSGLKDGMISGHFVFKKRLDLDLVEQGGFLGVGINIFDTNGKNILGAIAFPDKTAEQLTALDTQTLQNNQGESFDALIYPIVFNEQTLGYIAMSISQSLTYQKVLQNVYLLTGGGLLVMVFIGLVAYLFVVQIIRPLGNVAKLFHKIASLGGDLTQRLKTSGVGELGDLSRGFNFFIAKVQTIVKSVQESTETLASSSEELAVSTNQMSQTALTISQAISEEHHAVQKSSQSVETMVGSLEGMFDKINKIQEKATHSKKIAEHGRMVVEKSSNSMRVIEANTQKIEGVVEVITQIATQTNLLSLNAAIEAAKAGDLGKGFAVVADEVRALAEKSAQQVVEINNLVELSKKSVLSGAGVIGEIQTVFQQIDQEAEQVLQNVNEVTETIASQEKRVHVVQEGIKEISDLSQHNSTSIEELSYTLNLTAQTTDDLSSLADSIASNINEFKV